MTHLAQPGHCLGPAESFLDAFTNALGDRVAGVAGRAAVDRRTAAVGILSDMRGDRLLAQLHDKVADIVALVGTQGDRLRPVGVRLDQRQCGRRSAWPEARVVTAPTINPLRFSISAWPMKHKRASLPGPLRKSRASGSVVEACVVFRRRSPWKSCAPLRPGPGGSPEPSFGRKLFGLAQASSSVSSTEKCSLDNKRLTLSCESTAMRNLPATSPANNRSRFLVKVVASHTVSSMPSPTNQRNNKS